MDFTDTGGDEPKEGHIELLLEETRAPQAKHLGMKMAGSTVEEMGGFGSMEFYAVEGTAYVQNPEDGSWISFPMGEEDAFSEGFFDPAETLDLPKKGRRSQEPETINGIPSHHYSFTEEDVPDEEFEFENLQGDIWIAVDGGYVVKYEISATGQTKGDMEDLFQAGSMNIRYELLEVNTDFTITLPEEAQNVQIPGMGSSAEGGAGADLPVFDDAEEVTSIAGFLNYYTQSDIDTLVKFYREELDAQGWQEEADGAFIDETTALLSFAKEGQTLMVTMSKEDDGRTNVSVIAGEE